MNIIEALKMKLDAAQVWQKEICLARNQFLKVKGSIDTNLYFILSGSVRIFFEDEYEDQTLRLGYTHNFIAALDSFISEQASELYIQVLKKCTLRVTTKARFMEFLAQDPSHLVLWQKILEQLIYQQMEREKDLLTSSPATRYRRVLERSPQLFQEVPNKYIASYLRMTPETLSRLKKS
ncbi:MAG: Crp/Fnr family transcriptional regulator [Saprospiraceae bacterium]